jgi:hypothetical protein
MPRRACLSAYAHEAEQARVVVQLAIVAVHDLHLAPVKAFEAQIDVRRRKEIEPELGFNPAHVRHAAVAAPRAGALRRRIQHRVVTEVSFFRRQSKGDESPVRHGNLLHLRRDNLEDARFEDHVAVGGVDLRTLPPRALEVVEELRLAAPQTDAAADVLGADIPEHADVVGEIASAVEQAFHRNGARQIVLQHLARDGPAEFVAALVRPRPRAGEGLAAEGES